MSKESSNLEALVVTCDRHSEVVDMDDVRSAFGPILSEELQQWIDLSTRYVLESLDLDSPSEIVPPQHLSLSEMVNPRIGNTDNYIPHVFQSFLAGAMRIAQSTDEFVYVAALAGAVSEVSPVFLITDRYGDEIEAQAPSLESWLASTLSEADDEADEPRKSQFCKPRLILGCCTAAASGSRMSSWTTRTSIGCIISMMHHRRCQTSKKRRRTLAVVPILPSTGYGHST
jgi:hypothetical protein